MMEVDGFEAALAQLDAEIAATEERLTDLRMKRNGAQLFIDYMNDSRKPRPTRRESPTPSSSGSTFVVEAVMTAAGARPLSVAEVEDAVRDSGHSQSREQVRNALHYLSRKGVIESAGTRGVWRLKNAETPVVDTGVSGDHISPDRGGEDTNAQAQLLNQNLSEDGRNDSDRGQGASIGS